MEKIRKRSRHHYEKDDSPVNKRERCVVWEDHRSSLDDLFFRDCDLIKRGSQDYKDFWLFLERYEAFNKRHVEKHHRDKDSKLRTSSKLGLPLSYDRRYKINVALLSKDVTDVTGYSTTGTKKVYSISDKHGRHNSRELSKEDFLEFKSILLYYIDFCQKQKFSKLVKLKKDQANLPISHFREQIVDAVSNNQVVIIAGDTGCGKSTQVW